MARSSVVCIRAYGHGGLNIYFFAPNEDSVFILPLSASPSDTDKDFKLEQTLLEGSFFCCLFFSLTSLLACTLKSQFMRYFKRAKTSVRSEIEAWSFSWRIFLNEPVNKLTLPKLAGGIRASSLHRFSLLKTKLKNYGTGHAFL